MLICDGHSFIRGPGEHLFAQLYNWAVCREPCTKLGMNWEERILQLHWTVHAVVHTQHFINKHNVKCKPYGPWGHFLGQCTLKLITLSLRHLRRAHGAQEAFPTVGSPHSLGGCGSEAWGLDTLLRCLYNAWVMGLSLQPARLSR